MAMLALLHARTSKPGGLQQNMMCKFSFSSIPNEFEEDPMTKLYQRLERSNAQHVAWHVHFGRESMAEALATVSVPMPRNPIEAVSPDADEFDREL